MNGTADLIFTNSRGQPIRRNTFNAWRRTVKGQPHAMKAGRPVLVPVFEVERPLSGG